jgi:hypothetical protein
VPQFNVHLTFENQSISRGFDTAEMDQADILDIIDGMLDFIDFDDYAQDTSVIHG